MGWLPLFDFSWGVFVRVLCVCCVVLGAFGCIHSVLLVARWFCSYFGLCYVRVWACRLVGFASERVFCAFCLLPAAIRANYFCSSSRFSCVVATMLSNCLFFALWEDELTDLRYRLERMFSLFFNLLSVQGASRALRFLVSQTFLFLLRVLGFSFLLFLLADFVVFVFGFGCVAVAVLLPGKLARLFCAFLAVVSVFDMLRACCNGGFFMRLYQTGISSCRNGLCRRS
ncbi:hypothetical protein [Escherichia coli]|uniref:hypothetical protein n=1 Tax=Escherichia coli TaxID=562 RepID=UPI001867EDA8|nr:hypothetical protein [Escherichia coli]